MRKPDIPDIRAWVVSAEMGLGHQRAIYPLYPIAHEGPVSVGKDADTSPEEKKQWRRIRRTYEFISRAKQIPLIGNVLFNMLNFFLLIPPLYPLRKMSKSTFQVDVLDRLIEKGLCSGMVDKIKKDPYPVISSFYAPTLAADKAGITPNYCIICDSDLNRGWVAKYPDKSNVIYFAPCTRAVKRLRLYGVPKERVFKTGFPLPLELLGDKSLDVLREDMGQRLHYLDPRDRFWPLHRFDAEHFLGKKNLRFRRDRILTLTFAVGGAGAQKEIGREIVLSLKEKISEGRIRLNLVAGIRPEVRKYFEEVLKELDLDETPIEIIYGKDLTAYFKEFSRIMRTTDILWTKPSELSFYAGLGIPIIMAPVIGSQEEHNRKWLLEIQAGIDQDDPRYTDQWLFDLLEQGRLAESAWDGFLKAHKYGTYKIMEILQTGTMKEEKNPLLR